MEVKNLFSVEGSSIIKKLLYTGRDVLIREYEKYGVWYMYSRPAAYGRYRGRGDLYVQCYDQEEPFRADPGKRLRGLRLDQLIESRGRPALGLLKALL